MNTWWWYQVPLSHWIVLMFFTKQHVLRSKRLTYPQNVRSYSSQFSVPREPHIENMHKVHSKIHSVMSRFQINIHFWVQRATSVLFLFILENLLQCGFPPLICTIWEKSSWQLSARNLATLRGRRMLLARMWQHIHSFPKYVAWMTFFVCTTNCLNNAKCVLAKCKRNDFPLFSSTTYCTTHPKRDFLETRARFPSSTSHQCLDWQHYRNHKFYLMYIKQHRGKTKPMGYHNPNSNCGYSSKGKLLHVQLVLASKLWVE